MKKSLDIYFKSILIMLLLFSVGGAVEFESDKNVHISNIHSIDDDFYAWGENVTIDGTIEGDVIVGGYSVRINGEIQHSANVFGYGCTINGPINGSLRLFANKGTVNSVVKRSAVIFGSDILVGDKAVIKKDLIMAGDVISVNGTVRGNSRIYGSNITLTGNFESDVYIKGDKINIIPPAIIGGNLHYVSKQQANIDVPSGVTVLGETTWDLPEKSVTDKSDGFTTFIISLSELLAIWIFGLILLLVGKKYLQEALHQLKTRPAVSFGTGLLTLSILIFSFIVLISALVLMAIGGVLISENHTAMGAVILSLATLLLPISSFVTITSGLIIYSSYVAVGIFIGLMIFRRKQMIDFNGWHLLIGLIIITLLTSIPILGVLITFFILLLGGGAIFLGIKHCRPTIETLGKDAEKVD